MENTFSAVQSFSKERFMQEVQLFPVLYNKFDAEFKNIDMKKNAWIKIAEVFKITPVEAAEKYRSIRTAYGRYLKKKRLTPSGSGRSAVKHEYDYLQWLNIYIEHRDTSSNLPVESIMSPQSQQQQDQVFSSKTFQDSDAFTEAGDEALEKILESSYSTYEPLDSSTPFVTGPNLLNSSEGANASKESNMASSSRNPAKKGPGKRPPADHDGDELDTSLLKTMKRIGDVLDQTNDETQETDDEVMLFCKSIAPTLRRFNAETLAYVKLHIQQYLVQTEYPKLFQS